MSSPIYYSKHSKCNHSETHPRPLTLPPVPYHHICDSEISFEQCQECFERAETLQAQLVFLILRADFEGDLAHKRSLRIFLLIDNMIVVHHSVHIACLDKRTTPTGVDLKGFETQGGILVRVPEFAWFRLLKWRLRSP